MLKVLPWTQQQKLAEQVAGFLRELHAVPVPAAGVNLPIHDAGRRDGLPHMREQIREQLLPHMQPEAGRLVLGEFDAFSGDPHSFDYQRVLRHGDLGMGNILIDPQTQTISGVIDFGSAGLDDPATDLGFVALWGVFAFGKAFVAHLFDNYGVTESLLKRALFFKRAIALHIALGGLQKGNREDFEFGLAQCA
jgi:aminoglycoside 2''-phosphotransferase